MGTRRGKRCVRVSLRIAAGIWVCGAVGAGWAVGQTIMDEWATVKAPPAPELTTVMIDPKATALLVLDIQPQTCNVERRPRCLASVRRIQALVTQARAKGVAVVYSLARSATAADLFKEVARLPGKPAVLSGPDKFLATNLEKILGEQGICSVIAVGAASHGAVLYTAGGVARRRRARRGSTQRRFGT